MTLEKLFFELLQVAIGTRTEMSVMPKPKQWAQLFDMAQKQSQVAIAFRGV